MQWCIYHVCQTSHYCLSELSQCIERIPCYNAMDLLMKIQKLQTFLRPSSFSLVCSSLEVQKRINGRLIACFVLVKWSFTHGSSDRLSIHWKTGLLIYIGLKGSLNTWKARMSNKSKHAVCYCEYISGALWVMKNMFSICVLQDWLFLNVSAFVLHCDAIPWCPSE